MYILTNISDYCFENIGLVSMLGEQTPVFHFFFCVCQDFEPYFLFLLVYRGTYVPSD